jgi:glutathione S-transferase
MSVLRRLYDLAGADEQVRFSPYCWRVKLAMAHKNMPFETVAWHFTDKEAIAFSGQTKVPVLVDGETVLHDSEAIAEYLENAYANEPALFGDATQRALTRFIKHWTEDTLHPAIGRLVVPDIFALIRAQDQAYFRETREKMFGTTIEELAAKRESFEPVFRTVLNPLRRTLTMQPFVSGAGPAYADHIVFGALQWGCRTSAKPLLEGEDVIADWMARLLETYGIG